ncbi:hypothetical protein FXO38_36138 [Capsicum annuum]|nr:hypothetical protein FXO38_36138 [Capsicum annuum]KAF3685113.1 hypothetical protein FXO37_00950 [Capsicum annuum]
MGDNTTLDMDQYSCSRGSGDAYEHKTKAVAQVQNKVGATSSISYMELVKEVANKGPESQQNIAIRADEKSYSYLQLISSARRISNLLSKLGLKTVSWK